MNSNNEDIKKYSSNEIFEYLENINQIFLIYDYNIIIEKSVEILHTLVNFNNYAFFSMHSETGEYFIKKTNVKNLKEIFFIEEKEILEWVIQENKIIAMSIDENIDKEDCLCIPLIRGPYKSGILQLRIEDDWHLVSRHTIFLINMLINNLVLSLENKRMYKDMEVQAIESEKNKNFINNILESIPNGIITLDTDGIVTQINRNACVMFNLQDSSIIGENYRNCFAEKFKKELINIIYETKKQGFIIDKRIEIKRDEELIPLGINSSLFYDAKGNLLGMLIVMRDMTASKELERLRKIDQMKTEFVSNVSHELRTPLTSIKAYVDSLLNIVPMEDFKQRREFLNIIEEESDVLLRLIEDILNISKIESDKIVLDLKILFLKEIVMQSLQSIKYDKNVHNVIIDISSDVEIPADQERTRQVFTNLLSNAVKYSPEGGEIKISAKEENNKVYIKVQDQGLGMTETQVEKVFDKFYRADTSHNINGTGLGMALVKEILDKHEVSIYLESEFSKGTVVNIVWPQV